MSFADSPLMQPSFADLPGVRLRFAVHGSPDAPWLVLLHYLGSDLSMWDAQVPALAQRFRLLRFDARGHGRSSVAPGACTLAQMGADVLALMDALGIAGAHFCGLSMGGLVALWLAAGHPQRVRRLAACNTAARIGSPDGWAARIGQVQRLGMAAMADQIVPRWFSPAFAQAAAKPLDHLQAVFAATPLQGYVAACQALAQADVHGQLAHIGAPTLVVGGTHDVSTPMAQAHGLADAIAHAQLLELPAGHLSNVECPEAFNAAALAFFGAGGEPVA